MSSEKTKPVPKLRFPEFRDGPQWESRELGPMTLKVGSGITPTGGDKNYKAKGRPFVRSQNVGWGELILDDVAYINEEMHRSFNSTEIVMSDVLLNITGASIGRSAVADSRVVAGNVNQHVCIIRTKLNELNPFLLNQYLISQDGQSQIDIFQAGGNRQGLNFSQIRSFLIPLSQALSEQQKIADCLSSADELIAAQARKVEALKTHKKGLMQQLFPREGETQPRLRFPEFGQSVEWEVLPIGDKVELLSGYPFDGPGISQDSTGVPLLRGINVTEGRVRHNPEIDRFFTGATEALEKYKLQLNDLVIGMDGSKVGKNSALITTADTGALLIQRVARLRTKNVDLVRFIFQQINSSTFHRYVDKINTSSGIPHISAKQVKEFRLAFPSNQEQKRIADFFSNLDTLVTAATQELDTLKTHKEGLMQQLFPAVETA